MTDTTSLQPFNRLLVVMTDRHIGNLLVSLYAIAAARQALGPNQSLSCVIDYDLLSLARYLLPDITFIPCKLRGSNVSPWKKLQLFLQLRQLLRREKFDAAADLYGHGESYWIARLSGAKFISAFYSRPKLKPRYDWCDRSTTRQVHHQVDYYRLPFLPLLGELPRYEIKSPLNPEVMNTVTAKLKRLGISDLPLVVIHPGAGKPYKFWPSEHWQALIQQLESEGYQVLLIGAGADKAEVDAILKSQTIHPINGFGQLNLIETIHLGFLAKAMVGNDSGPTHLLSTTTVTVFSLFGPTNHKLWSPLSSNSHVLRAGVTCLAECSKQECHRHPSCLAALSPDNVLNALRKCA